MAPGPTTAPSTRPIGWQPHACSGHVVIGPLLAGNAGGSIPSVLSHPDVATLEPGHAWARSGREHASVLMPPPATGLVGPIVGAVPGHPFRRPTGE